MFGNNKIHYTGLIYSYITFTSPQLSLAATESAFELTVKGWAGFLSRISQERSTEFFMAAFTRKLVAKTTAKNKEKKKSSTCELSPLDQMQCLTCLLQASNSEVR